MSICDDLFGITAVIKFDRNEKVEIDLSDVSNFNEFQTKMNEQFPLNEYELKYKDQSYELRILVDNIDMKIALESSNAQTLWIQAYQKPKNPIRSRNDYMCQDCGTKNVASNDTCELCGKKAPFLPE